MSRSNVIYWLFLALVVFAYATAAPALSVFIGDRLFRIEGSSSQSLPLARDYRLVCYLTVLLSLCLAFAMVRPGKGWLWWLVDRRKWSIVVSIVFCQAVAIQFLWCELPFSLEAFKFQERHSEALWDFSLSAYHPTIALFHHIVPVREGDLLGLFLALGFSFVVYSAVFTGLFVGAIAKYRARPAADSAGMPPVKFTRALFGASILILLAALAVLLL